MNCSIKNEAKTVKLWPLISMVCLILVGCGLCGNETDYEEVSPDGKLKAVVFERDCGATTRATTQISVLRKSEPLPNEAGNIFIAKGHSLIRMQWRSDTELLITYPPGTNVSLRQKQRDRVSIHYDESSAQ